MYGLICVTATGSKGGAGAQASFFSASEPAPGFEKQSNPPSESEASGLWREVSTDVNGWPIVRRTALFQRLLANGHIPGMLVGE
jgi:hypothetical protein